MNDFPAERYLSFYGDIKPAASDWLRNKLIEFINEGAQKVTILFASAGGSTDDGRALFTLIRAMPYTITMHAVGVVGSMAIPVFLSVPAGRRIVSKHAAFFFHQLFYDFGATNIAQIVAKEADVIMDNALDWQRRVLKSETKITDTDIQTMQLFRQPQFVEPARAIELGIAGAQAEPKISVGSLPKIACA